MFQLLKWKNDKKRESRLLNINKSFENLNVEHQQAFIFDIHPISGYPFLAKLDLEVPFILIPEYCCRSVTKRPQDNTLSGHMRGSHGFSAHRKTMSRGSKKLVPGLHIIANFYLISFPSSASTFLISKFLFHACSCSPRHLNAVARNLGAEIRRKA